MKKPIVPIVFVAIIVLLVGYLVSSSYRKQKKTEFKEAVTSEATDEIVTLDELSAGDTVILLKKDTTAKKLTVRNIAGSNEYQISYDNSISFKNKYGDVITISEITCGEILDVIYSKHSGKVSEVKVSDKTWTLSEMTDYEIKNSGRRIDLMGDAYEITKDTVFYSNGEPIQLMDITQMDTLIVKGYNRKVCSIIVEKGHGYLRVLNDAYFVGGWIEVGQKIIKPLTEEMLLPVPEGDYTVRVTNRGYVGTQDVTIERDMESKLDLSKVDIEEVAVGHVEFKLSPIYAQLYVDGEMMEYEDRVPLEYGVHKVKVTAAGYQTVETNIKIGDEYANIEIALDPETSSEGEEEAVNKLPPTTTEGTTPTETPTVETSDTTTESSMETTISDIRKIYVESPEGVEVYLDGNYIGVAPISTGKVTGSHTITLSMAGYATKSYTIYVENDDNDVTLSFSELLPE